MIFVMGMHRTGTSLTTALLSSGGLCVDADMKGDQWNPLGYYERNLVKEINDEILEAAGGDWLNPPNLARFDNIRKDCIRELLNVDVMKDPRFCFTFSVWEKYLPKDKIQIIFTHREPMNVAFSLFTRDKLELERGIELYYQYEQAAERFKKYSHIDIDYEEYFRDKDSVLNRLKEFAGLRMIDESLIKKDYKHY